MSIRNKFSAIQVIRSWTLDNVVYILEKNGLLDCCEAFKKRDVDGENLLALTEGKLALWKRDLTLADIRKLAYFIQDLNDSPEKYVEQSKASCDEDALRKALKLRAEATLGGSESPLSDSGSWDTDFDDETEDTDLPMPAVIKEAELEPTPASMVATPDHPAERLVIKPPIASRPSILGRKPLHPQRSSVLPEPPSGHNPQVMNFINDLTLPPEIMDGLMTNDEFNEDFYESIDNTDLPSKADIAMLLNRSMAPSRQVQATVPASLPDLARARAFKPGLQSANPESLPDLLRSRVLNDGSQVTKPRAFNPGPNWHQAQTVSSPDLVGSQAFNLTLQLGKHASSPDIQRSQSPDQGIAMSQTLLKDELNQLPPLRKISIPNLPSGRLNHHLPLVGIELKSEQPASQANKSQLFRHLASSQDMRQSLANPGSKPPPVPNSPKPAHQKPPLQPLGQSKPSSHMGNSSQMFRQLPPLPGQNNSPEVWLPASPVQQPNPFQFRGSSESQAPRIPGQPPRNTPLQSPMVEPEEQYESVDEVAVTLSKDYDSDEYESIKDNTAILMNLLLMPESQEEYVPPVGSPGEPPALPAKPGRTKPPEAMLPSTRPPSPPRKKSDDGSTWNLKFRNLKKNLTKPYEPQKDKSPVPELRRDLSSQVDQKSATLDSRSNSVSQRPLPPTPQPESLRSSTLPPRKSSRDLMHQPWYRSIDRQKAEELLMGGEDGSFVVRPSSQTRNPLTLTLHYNRNMYHISVRQRPDGRFALGLEKPEEQCFSSIEELILNYQSEKLVVYRDGKKAGATLLTSSPKQ